MVGAPQSVTIAMQQPGAAETWTVGRDRNLPSTLGYNGLEAVLSSVSIAINAAFVTFTARAAGKTQPGHWNTPWRSGGDLRQRE